MRTRRAALIGFLLAFAPAMVSAGPTYQVPIGPRALGMGSAFSAVADDATAGYWNSAGLPFLRHQEISATRADLYGSGITDSYLSFVLPLSVTQAAGVDWYNSGFDDDELGFHENRIQLSYGQRLNDLLSLGVGVKYLSRSTDLDGVNVRQGGGFGLDLGVLASPFKGVRMGLTVQDATDTRLNYRDDDGMAVAFPRSVRGGVAVEPRQDLLLAFDVDDRWHAGLEYTPVSLFSLRGGLEKDWQSPDGLVWSAGSGIKVGYLRLDYARVDHPMLGATNHFGVSFEFNFNPAQVRIEQAETRDIYASLYKSYARDPFGAVQLRNLDSEPIRAKVSLFVPELMTTPTEQEVVLRPKASRDVPLTAVMSQKVLDQGDDQPVQATLAVTYQSARLPRTERTTTQFIAYAPGAVNWSAGVDQAGAFVTSQDPMVNEFARAAVFNVPPAHALPETFRNVLNMAAIVDALSALGVKYVPDPHNPYSTVSATPRAVDNIAYPRETLVRRTGDCDDTTVLTAALLGNVGIETQLVDVPGHLFLLADTGVHERQWLAMGLAKERFVIEDDRVWIPIETTELSKGFAGAWQAGLDAYSSWKARGRLARVDVAAASSRYEPAVPSAGPETAPAFDFTAVAEMVDRDVEMLTGWRSEFLAKMYSESGSGPEVTEEALNEIAQVYFTAGRTESAASHLNRALALAPGSPRSLNNLGNVRVVEGDLVEGIRLYEEATGGAPLDAGMWLNLGLARYVSGDSLGARKAMSHGIELSGGYEEACRLLGVPPGELLARGASQRMTEEEVRTLLEAALSKVPQAPRRGSVPTTAPPDSLPPAPKWVGRVAGSRAANGARLHLNLYWK